MMLNKVTFIFGVLFILLQSYVSAQGLEAQPAFIDFADAYEMPDGIATDAQGNVYIHFETTRTTELVQLRSNGTFLDQQSFGTGLFDRVRFLGSRLDLDPELSLNTVVMITPDGELRQIQQTSSGFRVELRSAIQAAEVITDNVYDIHLGQTVPFGLSAETLMYGDIALFRSAAVPDKLELYVTGLSRNSREPSQALKRPLVMRIVADSQLDISAAEIVLISSAETFTFQDLTRGIAVNRQGTVLVTLPMRLSGALNPEETIDVAVMFSTAVALDSSILPALTEPVLLLDLDLPSQGMTTDTAGNFYIATSDVGSSVCEPNRSGALLVIPVDTVTGLPLLVPEDTAAGLPTPLGTINRPICLPIPPITGIPVSSSDVAVSPIDHSIYVTLNILSRVVRSPPLMPVLSLTAD